MANEVKFKLAIEGFEAVKDKLDKVEQKIGGLAGAIGKMGHIGAALYAIPTALNATVGSAMRAADAITTLNTQLRLATGSAAQASKAYSALFDIAQQSRVSFTELGTTFAAISRAGREMGVSQERLLVVTQSISQAMTIGGGSAASMNAALIQLGQGLSSGVLRGEELNSIMEQTPRLAKAIANGLGVPIGKLRELGAAGQLTGEQVISALERSGPQLAKEMESATLTVGQALTLMGNSAANFIGQVDQAVGLSTKVAQAMQHISQSMDGVSKSSAAIGFLTNDFRAAGEAMDAAKRRGSGFFGQFNQGMGMLIGRATAMQYLSRDFMTLDQAVADATATINRLDAQEQKFGKLSIYSMSERATAVRDLARANRELAASQPAATANSYANEDAKLAAHTAAWKARMADQAAFAKAGEAYLSPAQKNQKLLQDETEKNSALLAKGSITAEQFNERINAVRASFEKKVSAGGLSEAAKGLALYNDLMAKDNGLAANFEEQAISLSKAKLSTQQLTEAMGVLVSQQPFMLAAAKAQADASKEAAKADEQAFKAMDDLRVASEKQITTARTTLEQIEFETRLLTMNTEQRALATLERDLEAKGIVKGTLAYDAYIVKLREAMAIKTGKEAGIKAADDMRRAQEKAAEESSKYWEDALMRAFESGKGFFQSLWDTIKNTLKTQVLKVIVQGTMGALGLGASGAAMASGGGADGMAGLGTLASLGSVASGTGILGAAGNIVGGAVGAGTVGTGISATIGQALAAIPGVGWAILAAAAVAAIASGRGETRSGAAYVTGADGKAAYQQGPSGGEIAGASARSLFETTKTSIQDTLKLVGSSATVTGFVAGLESSKNGKGFAYAGGLVGGKAFGENLGRDGGQFAMSSMTQDQAMGAYVTNLKQATLQALQAASDIPKIIADQLTGVDINALDTAGLDKLIDTISGTVNAVNSFTQQINTGAIKELHDLGFAAAAGLIAASGGLDKLQENLGTYYTNFYNAEEQRLQTIKTINAAIAGSGLDAATATRESFRATVESFGTAAKLATPEGQKMYASLLSVSGAMAGLIPPLEDTSKAARQATLDLEKVNQGWQDKLDVLTGAQTDRSLALRDATDDTTRALMEQVYAQEDLKTAAELRKTNAQAAAEAETAAAELRKTNAQAAAEGAMSALQRAVAAQRKIYQVQADAAQSAVTEIKSIFDTLEGNIKTLYGQVDSAQSAASGRRFIENALSNARKTGYMPDSKDLSSAIQSAMSDSTVYASQADDDFAKLSLAGSMVALKNISGDQLTTAEKQLQYAKDQLTSLDQTIELAQAQLNAANGIDTSVKSVEQALGQLANALTQVNQANGKTGLGSIVAGPMIGSTGIPARLPVTGPGNITDRTLIGYGGKLARDQTAYTETWIADEIKAALALGFNAADIAKGGAANYGIPDFQILAAGKRLGLPGFAIGTNRVPYDMTAEIHEGEAIIPKAYNPAAGGASGNARLEALVEALTKEVQRLQTIVNDGNKSNERIATTLDNVTEGGSNMRTVTA